MVTRVVHEMFAWPELYMQYQRARMASGAQLQAKNVGYQAFFIFTTYMYIALGIVHIFKNLQVQNLDHNKSAVGQGGHKINALQNLGWEWSQN